MVPHSASPPPPERRALRPETVAELHTVIAEHWRSMPGTGAALNALLARVSTEARADGVRAEELIIALKSLEAAVLGAPGTLRANDVEARRRFREWLVSQCITAYFAPPASPDA